MRMSRTFIVQGFHSDSGCGMKKVFETRKLIELLILLHFEFLKNNLWGAFYMIVDFKSN